jgi:hypothetical protein
MEKNKALLIGGGIGLAAIIAVYYFTSKNSGVMSNTTTLIAPGTCPAGQVPCNNNRLKCYNPSANYTIDPCATTSVVTNPSANPIAEIVDGIIGLFKKKPATPTA